METMKELKMARFDVRLPQEQKTYFEEAASLGGFKTLTEFIAYSLKLQADKIVEKHNAILISKKDQEIFFDAIMNPPEPSDKLKKAAREYMESVGRK
jgi:uncharacterized protein (DUF1778 family)